MRNANTYVLSAVALAWSGVALAEGAPVYSSPQAALDGLVAGLEQGDADAVVAALSPDAADLVESADPAALEDTMKELVGLYRDGYRFVPNDEGVIIEMGKDDWPFPVPLVRAADGWSYDIASARDEILARRIGINELEVIDALEGYVAIQSEYRQTDHDGDGVMEFAASMISTPGMRDGLYWPADDSPIGDLAARASLDGFSVDGSDTPPEPFEGYYFRLLQEQGASAPGGAMSYLVNGHMVSGHALLAVPAEYGETGRHSFMVSEQGTIWEADLGPDTLKIAFDIMAFDPRNAWRRLSRDE